jgi:CRISPR-associated protein Csm2
MTPPRHKIESARHNRPRNQSQETNRIDWVSKFNKSWIAEKLDKSAISFAEEFGKSLAKNLTTNQIRNFFGEVRRIEMKGISKEKTRFLLLAPKLAYAAKRASSEAAENFKKVMIEAYHVVVHEENDDQKFEQRFKNFVQFLEAILAYHKAHGGK